jgi:signal transduction histidine kinase
VCEVGADKNFPRAEAAHDAGLAGGFAVPVRSAGAFIGVLEFFSRAPQLPDVAMQRSLETVASQVGQFVIRRREEARAQRLTAELNAIFDLNPDAFVAFDAHDRLSYANPALEQITGVARQRGLSLEEFDAALAAQCEQPVYYKSADVQAGDEVDEIILARPRPRTLQRTQRYIGGERRLGRVLYLRDVTHEKEVERMKSEFLSIAAHELRTPMASIYGFTELLLARNYDEGTRRELLSTINRQTALLTRMVNELLDLARIEARAGRDFDIASRPLGLLLEQVLQVVPVGAQAERLVFDGLPHPLEVLADPDKLLQALTNLLSNAFKYSPGGGPVTVRVTEREVDGIAMVGVSFGDRGIGMTPEQLAHATERFYRADTSGNIPGTGLGLSLVKEIVTLMGGQLELASTFGEGTTATIWLRAA